MALGDRERPTIETYALFGQERGARCWHCGQPFEMRDLRCGDLSRQGNRHYIEIGAKMIYRTLYYVCGSCDKETAFERALQPQLLLPGPPRAPIVDVRTANVGKLLGLEPILYPIGSLDNWHFEPIHS